MMRFLIDRPWYIPPFPSLLSLSLSSSLFLSLSYSPPNSVCACGPAAHPSSPAGGATRRSAAALSLRAADGAASEVQLRIDKSVPYGRVAEVMAEIQKSELLSLSLAVQTPAPKIQITSPPPRN
jgi:hypothetical protein